MANIDCDNKQLQTNFKCYNTWRTDQFLTLSAMHRACAIVQLLRRRNAPIALSAPYTSDLFGLRPLLTRVQSRSRALVEPAVGRYCSLEVTTISNIPGYSPFSPVVWHPATSPKIKSSCMRRSAVAVCIHIKHRTRSKRQKRWHSNRRVLTHLNLIHQFSL